jgi:hypothetical protein
MARKGASAVPPAPSRLSVCLGILEQWYERSIKEEYGSEAFTTRNPYQLAFRQFSRAHLGMRI